MFISIDKLALAKGEGLNHMSNRLPNRNILAVPAAAVAALGITACGGGEAEPKATVTETVEPTETVQPTEAPSATTTETPTPEPTPEVAPIDDMEIISADEFRAKYSAEAIITERINSADIPMNEFQLKDPEMENESTLVTAIVANLDERAAMPFRMGTYVPDSYKDYFRDKASDGITDPVWSFNEEAGAVVDVRDFIENNYQLDFSGGEYDLPRVDGPELFGSRTQAYLMQGAETFTPKYGHYALSTSPEDNKIAENYQVNSTTDLESVEWEITKAGSLTISGEREVYDNIAQGKPGDFYYNPSATSHSWKATGKIDQSTGKVTIESRQLTDFDPEGTNMKWPERY